MLGGDAGVDIFVDFYKLLFSPYFIVFSQLQLNLPSIQLQVLWFFSRRPEI